MACGQVAAADLGSGAWRGVSRIEGGSTTAGTATAPGSAQFGGLAVLLGSVAAVVAGRGILIDERRTGPLEWMLSKPLSRAALVVAKFVGHSAALLVTVVLVPRLGVRVQLSLAEGSPWPVGPTAGAGLLADGGPVSYGPVVSAASLTCALPAAGAWGLRRTEL